MPLENRLNITDAVELARVEEKLSKSVNPTTYWRKLKERLKKEGNQTVTNCHALKMSQSLIVSRNIKK